MANSSGSDGSGGSGWTRRRRAFAVTLVFVAAAVLSTVTLLAVQWAAAPTARSSAAHHGLGFVRLDRPARDLSLPSLRGRGTIDLAGLAGTPIVMNFWSSTCGPCKQETPALASVAREVGGKVAFLGIDTIDARQRAIAFVTRYRVAYPIAFDPQGKAANRYGVLGLPVTVFLSPSAKTVVGENVGALTSHKLRVILRLLYGVS